MYACQGCGMYGHAARALAERLDRDGSVEAAWTGAPGLTPKARFPIIALDSCGAGCALQWLARHGARADRHYDLSVPGTMERIAADLT
ncbi:MAG TPA: putative zinc-binding protein [Burkholderiales bacterium]|jgi:uncharacterized metal-binding protein|nr:putative zinc-binding protein [Burkholderiales bacterium]